MAQIVQSSSPTRLLLGERLPLQTPLSIHMFTSYVCDFKCIYCPHGLKEREFQEMFGKQKFMSFKTFKHAIDGLQEFPEKLKMISFDGWGEPLLNPEISEMITYAKKRDVADRIELVTNSYSLTHEKADAIIAAGLDRIRISIQGLSAKKYLDVSNVKIDYNKLREQLKYLYVHRKQLSVYIKIIDVALDGESEQLFYDLFGDICDHIAVEHMVPTAEKINYAKYKDDYYKSQQGYDSLKVEVCPYPFYMMIVEPEGDVRTCCATRHPICLGNVNNKTLYDIWNGSQLHAFWRKQLHEYGRYGIAVCMECLNPDYGLQPGDFIDDYRQQILEKVEPYGRY